MATLGTQRIPVLAGQIGVATTREDALLVKRAFDMVASALGLLMLGWLFALVALAVKCDSRGPVLFTQRRLGKDGNPFTILKFRTMSCDQEPAAQRHTNRTTGLLYKNAADPRITPLGRVLRRTSLDELPQLINILRGDMSLVGPRPLPTEDARYFDGKAWERQAVVPGLSGLWQVSGRSNLSADSMIDLDLAYIRTWSLKLDALILFKTVRAVLSGDGAC